MSKKETPEAKEGDEYVLVTFREKTSRGWKRDSISSLPHT
jgi:hypothetical protein